MSPSTRSTTARPGRATTSSCWRSGCWWARDWRCASGSGRWRAERAAPRSLQGARGARRGHLRDLHLAARRHRAAGRRAQRRAPRGRRRRARRLLRLLLPGRARAGWTPSRRRSSRAPTSSTWPSPRALTVADRPDWNLLFFYVVAMGALRLPRPWNVVVLPVTSVVAGADRDRRRRQHGRRLGPGPRPAGHRRGDGRDGRDHAHQPRPGRGPRRGGAAGRGRRARALRARPARPARPFAVGHRAQGPARAQAPARRPRARPRPTWPTSRPSRATPCARCARRSAATTAPALDAELEGARTALDAAGIDATIDRPQVALPPDVEAVLAWTVREAATNVIRHSGARHSAIRLVPALGEATVEVVDDGDGPWPGAAPSTARATGSPGSRRACARPADAWRRARATTARASGCARWSR